MVQIRATGEKNETQKGKGSQSCQENEGITLQCVIIIVIIIIIGFMIKWCVGWIEQEKRE